MQLGWNQVTAQAGNRLFRGIDDGSYFYFVHGYTMPLCTATIAQASYDAPFTAAVEREPQEVRRWFECFGLDALVLSMDVRIGSTSERRVAISG